MESELSLNDYWRILRRRQWVEGMVFAATFLSTVVYTRLQTPLYQASAVVRFEPPPGRLSSGLDQGTAMGEQLQLLQSQRLAAAVAERLKVAVDKLPGSIGAAAGDAPNTIVITATGIEPLRVADMANAAVDAYVGLDLQLRTERSRSTLRDLDERRSQVQASLHKLEDEKKQFMRENPLAGQGGGLAGSLSDLEARRRELGKKFTPEHPEMLRMQERVLAIKAQLQSLDSAQMRLDSLSRDMRIQEEAYLQLSREYETAKVELTSILPWVTPISQATPPDSPFYPKTKLNYGVGAALGLFLAVFIAFVLENLDVSISTIEELEQMLEVPVLGMIPHSMSLSRWEEVKTSLLRRSRYPIEVTRSQLVFQARPHSPAIEVYHSLRANIQNFLPGKSNLVLSFTSAGVAEGKSLISLNFCLAAAQAGLKTLFVEADVRQPTTYRVFGLPRSRGLMEVLAGKMPWQEAVHGTSDFLMGEYDADKLIGFSGIDHFKLITGYAASGSDVVGILSSPAAAQFIAEARAHFDLVVFDTPPALLFVDALLVSARVDGVVLVYKAGKMARRALKRAKDQIVSAKGKVVGVVLNDMRSADMGPRYGYYADYGHYAAPEEKKAGS